ncbi:MAG TPA: DUF4012 domain-containing protein [Ktedonobacteraceae bacterium]|nr:DUF4012 domain-containing protein [Ktedonobacteraceae bacterium]
MSSVPLVDFPTVDRDRPDITSWAEVNIAELSARERKYFAKRKAAVHAYLTSQQPLNEIAYQYHLSPRTLKRLIKKCLMRHEDGTPWGYRALVPGITVIDHTPAPVSGNGAATPNNEHDGDEEDTAERGAIKKTQTATALPVTPIPPAQLQEQQEERITGEEPVTGKIAAGAALHAEPAVIDANDTPVEIDPDETDKIDRLTSAPCSIPLPTEVDPDETDKIDRRCLDTGKQANETDATSIDDLPGEEEQEVGTGAVVEGEGGACSAQAEPAPASVSDPSMADGSGEAPSLHFPERMALQPYRPTSLYRAPVRMVHKDRRIRKRRMRSERLQRVRRRQAAILSGAVAAAMLMVLLIPVGTGLAAYSTYAHIRGVALDGVNNLLAVKDLLPISKSDPTAALNAAKLHQAQKDLTQAGSDFLELQQLVNRSDIASLVDDVAPQYSNQLGMARHLVQVGLDVSHMGNELLGVALLGANILHGSPLSSGSNAPLITAADVSDAEGALVHAQYYINDIQTQMSQVSIQDLPISDKQKTELTSVLALMPKAQSLITQAQGVTGIVSWLLGIGHPRRFLVQTMDNAELRPSGGFTGQYGILTISNGRMAPFTLQDVTELDYAGNGTELGRPAPPQYRSWMNFGNWGLRDANLSGDYPTSAKLAMQVFQEEGGGPVDGDISFTPTLISHVLEVTGPIQVPEYHETITAQNLEDKLHYYQQNQQAIQLQREKTGTNNAATRKAFTSLLGKILLDKVRHLSIKQLMTVMQKAVKDIQSHDLEIYFSDPQAEAWLVAHGYAGGMSTFTRQDGFMVVQANISISKASQYVHTTEQDNVVLDAQGGATHTLTITLNYQQTGPVYGYDTYADYIRVYAPQDAQLLYGDGFDTGKPLCGPGSPGGTGGTPGGGTGGTPGGGNGGTGKGNGNGNGGVPPGCQQYLTMFPGNERYCPDGDYALGQNAYVPGKGFTSWPIDGVGAPTELTSDMPGRAMWGGLTVTPKNCISYITLSWYVPHVVKHTPGQSPYQLLVQKQGGYIPTIQISIDTSAIKGLKPYNFNGALVADRVFALPILKKK